MDSEQTFHGCRLMTFMMRPKNLKLFRYLNPTTLHMYEPHSIHTGRLHCAENNAKQTPVLNAFSAAERRSCGRVLSVQPTLPTPSLGIDGQSGWTQSDHGGGKLSKSPLVLEGNTWDATISLTERLH